MKHAKIHDLIDFFSGVLASHCFAEDVASDQFKSIDLDRIPRLKGEENNPPDIIFFSLPGTASTIKLSEMTSQNHIDVYLAVWYRTGKIIWSDRSSKPSDWQPPTIYYESYLERKQLDEFWNKYRDIKAWQHFGWGSLPFMGPSCHLYVSAKWSRNHIINKPEDYLYDSSLFTDGFDWPTLKEYERYTMSSDGMEAWLRLRHNVCLLIPYRPKEVRHREKVDVTFYFPQHVKENNPDNSDLSIDDKKTDIPNAEADAN